MMCSNCGNHNIKPINGHENSFICNACHKFFTIKKKLGIIVEHDDGIKNIIIVDYVKEKEIIRVKVQE